MKNGEKPIANPLVVLREEFDDWAVLFDPDTGRGFGLSPTGAYLWKHLDGSHSIDDMLKALRGEVPDIPQEAGEHLAAFVEELTAQGLAGYDVEPAHDDRGRIPPRPTCAGTMGFNYEASKLINLSGERAEGACCSSGTSATGLSGCCSGACNTNPCYGGTCAGADCIYNGSSAQGTYCQDGTSPSHTCGTGNSPPPTVTAYPGTPHTPDATPALLTLKHDDFVLPPYRRRHSLVRVLRKTTLRRPAGGALGGRFLQKIERVHPF